MPTSALTTALGPALFGRFLDAPAHNPDFPLTHAQAALEFERMRATPPPQPLARPVLVLAGYHAWRLMVMSTARTLASLVGGPGGGAGIPKDHFHTIAYPFSSNLDSIARRVVRDVERMWPQGGGEPHRTAEIDVVGVSMGGLVARLAAQLPLVDGQKRLRIVRLFTLGTPHRGALLSDRLPDVLSDRAARDMRTGSPMLTRLNASLPTARYDLTCYARLNDRWCGATRCAPPGREPNWVSGLRFMSHTTITADTRILADIARRLRGEEPIARRCVTPPPCD